MRNFCIAVGRTAWHQAATLCTVTSSLCCAASSGAASSPMRGAASATSIPPVDTVRPTAARGCSGGGAVEEVEAHGRRGNVADMDGPEVCGQPNKQPRLAISRESAAWTQRGSQMSRSTERVLMTDACGE
jgi:hypothetical protein